MVKCEVIEGFTLAKFDELENLERANSDKNKEGELFVGDTFTCTEDMANYLVKDNSLQRPFVRIVEVIPEKETKKQIEKENVMDDILKTTLDDITKKRTRRKKLED